MNTVNMFLKVEKAFDFPANRYSSVEHVTFTAETMCEAVFVERDASANILMAAMKQLDPSQRHFELNTAPHGTVHCVATTPRARELAATVLYVTAWKHDEYGNAPRSCGTIRVESLSELAGPLVGTVVC